MSATDPLGIAPQDYSTVDFNAFAYKGGLSPLMQSGLQGISSTGTQSFQQSNGVATFAPYLQPDTSSARVGAGAVANGTLAVAVGPRAFARENNSTAVGSNAAAQGESSTVVGANANVTGYRSTLVGADSALTGRQGAVVGHNTHVTGSRAAVVGESAKATSTDNTVVGQGAFASGTSAIAAGQGAIASGAFSWAVGTLASATFDHSMAIGHGATTTAANQIVLGSDTAPMTDVFMGTGPNASSVSAITLHGAERAPASNVAGGDIYIAGGRGRGTGAGGDVKVQTAKAGTTGSSFNALTDIIDINSDGTVFIGGTPGGPHTAFWDLFVNLGVCFSNAVGIRTFMSDNSTDRNIIQLNSANRIIIGSNSSGGTAFASIDMNMPGNTDFRLDNTVDATNTCALLMHNGTLRRIKVNTSGGVDYLALV